MLVLIHVQHQQQYSFLLYLYVLNHQKLIHLIHSQPFIVLSFLLRYYFSFLLVFFKFLELNFQACLFIFIPLIFLLIEQVLELVL
jgi:hypothetical protein